MKKIIILPIILLLVVITSGCVNQVTCNPPYILVGTECCLDANDNKICDKDETTTVATTVLTTAETTTVITTIPARIGELDVSNEFFLLCKKPSNHEDWCSIETHDSTNEVTINTSSLGAQEHNLAEIGTRIYNKGNSDIINISYEISCDQTYPTYESRVITGDGDKYETVIPKIYFWCSGCLIACDCTPERYGQIINKLRIADEISFRIELSNVKYFPYKADLDCNLKIQSLDPKAEYNFDLIIHFNV